jgi:hydroxymethylpyrimidine/phosphomethylpyrimidine kinase
VGGGDPPTDMTRRPIALTIAGSDSGAGAGVQADLKTFAAHGVYGASVITAVTAQNTLAVRAIHLIPPEIVAAQIDAIFEDFSVAAVKVGMLGSAEIARAVATALVRHAPPFVVYDPVLGASSGEELSREGLVAAVRAELLPRVDCLTPNLAEAGALLGEPPARDEAGMRAQGRALVALGPGAVLMKGGHLEGDAVDWLIAEREHRFAAARIASRDTHGTGCTLSSAIAAGVVRGLSLVEAVGRAKTFVRASIERGRELQLGQGPGPLIQLALD